MARRRSSLLSIAFGLALIIALAPLRANSEDWKLQDRVLFSGSCVPSVVLAYQDFAKLISEYSEDSSPLSQFLTKIENYSIELKVSDGRCAILFLPNEYEGSRLKGGGAKYLIDSSGPEILDKARFK